MTPYHALKELQSNTSLSEEQVFFLECIVAQDPYQSYNYSKTVLKKRFELGEASIATNARISCDYTQNFLKGRFLLGEKIIKRTKLATHYESAISMLKYWKTGVFRKFKI